MINKLYKEELYYCLIRKYLYIFLLPLLPLAIVLYTYSPFFFGDELAFLGEAIKHNFSFSKVYISASAYKPRIVFNSLMAILAVIEAPRYVYSILLGLNYIAIILLSNYFIVYVLKYSKILSCIFIIIVLSSRYGVMFFYDNILGIIETLSLLFFLLTLFFLIKTFSCKRYILYIFLAIFFALLTIFTHERYAVPIFMTGIIWGILVNRYRESESELVNKKAVNLISALFLSLMPIGLFVFANYYYSSMPLDTGTSARAITISNETLLSFSTYFLNLFLGFNFGLPWFWGEYIFNSFIGKFLSIISTFSLITIFLVAYIRNKIKFSLSSLYLFILILSFIAIASLVGLDRQEARFMYPAGYFLLFLYLIILQGKYKYVVLFLFLSINFIYLITGSFNYINSIYSNRAAHSVAESLISLRPIGKNILIYGNSDNSWIFGKSYTLEAFNYYNLKSQLSIDIFDDSNKLLNKNYDLGLSFVGYKENRAPIYNFVTSRDILIHSGLIDVGKLNSIHVFGNSHKWDLWQKNSLIRINKDGLVVLSPGAQAHLLAPTEVLRGYLTYTARLISEDNVPMRIQVNWHSKTGFINASIIVVNPNNKWTSYSAKIEPPLNAEFGYIYLSLQDGAKGEVEIKEVSLK